MEATGVSSDVLLERPWLPVSIDGCHLLAKSWFGETRCRILLTDLHCVWEETMHTAAIQSRAQVCLHLVRPLLSMSHVLHQQVDQLEGLLARKDAEIQDYKDNGATLSRARLQTDIFDQPAYRSSFLAKTLPLVCCDHHGSQNFSGNLQELYAAVVAHGNARKRKLSEQDQQVALNPDLPQATGDKADAEAEDKDSDQKQTSQVEEPKNSATAQQVVVPRCRAERASSKAKKKKVVGLFR
uniref:non-homologous end-joining factor 1 isoform X2 n=1 Tax=Doryrhamphus excisus TaxID=161450 RepID=UPI0025AE482B|nr:non-homologous end-joining factor 1 isoform X2 [Doryrhamphus excisus]